MIDAGGQVQEHVSATAIQAVSEFLGGPVPDGDGWRFELGEHLESNWGAVYGGALAASVLSVARAVAPDRSPRSLHVQIVRSVSRGTAYASARMRHSGRTVGTVEVDLYDQRRKLAAIALITMVTPGAVAAQHHDVHANPRFRLKKSPVNPDLDSYRSPVTKALELVVEEDGADFQLHVENARRCVDQTMTAALQCAMPWDALESTGPEAACLASDAIIASPIMQSFVPLEDLGPNADLTLRFTTAPATRLVHAAATMLSVQHGTATIGIEVQAGDHQLAHGLATSLLLASA